MFDPIMDSIQRANAIYAEHRPGPSPSTPSHPDGGTRVVVDSRDDRGLDHPNQPSTPEAATMATPEDWMPGDPPLALPEEEER